MIKGEYNVKISLCGDLFFSRRFPDIDRCKNLSDIKEILQECDCRFGNLETAVLNKNEGYPELFPGGGYAMASPFCLKDLKGLGFNLLNAATNHAMDYSHNGLLKTIENLKKEDLVYAGIGKNLADASKAAFLECPNARVALIGVTSSFHDSYAAGPQNQDMIGRPGVAPLKHKAIYEVTEQNYNELSRIADETGVNSYHNMAINTGYLVGSPNLKFGAFEFQKGECNKVHTTPNKSDLERTLSVVRDARIQADVVIVSIHSHQIVDDERRLTPEFISIFAKECIDAGADIVVCHGPHRLRGIEIYNNKPIFHGLGNFIFQHEQQEYYPEEFYQKYGTTRSACDGVGTINNTRSKNGTVGLISTDEDWISILATLNCVNGKYDISIYPVSISKQTGLPSIINDDKPLLHLKTLSREYGTDIRIENNIAKIQI